MSTVPATPDPTVERFHRLARSSPWRWDTLRFTWASFTGPDGHEPRDTVVAVRAHLRRPHDLRVETLDGELLDVVGPEDRSPPALLVRRTTWLERGRARLRRDPRPQVDDGDAWDTDQDPGFDDDGLVTSRPWGRHEADDPMWDNYTFVAALDPLELSDAEGTALGTRVAELSPVDHHGRLAWEAIVHPTDTYHPRCPCCSLLLAPTSFSDVGEEPDPALVWPDAHRVRLDTATGVCVLVEQVGGSRAGTGHELVIEAVDDPMPDHLF